MEQFLCFLRFYYGDDFFSVTDNQLRLGPVIVPNPCYLECIPVNVTNPCYVTLCVYPIIVNNPCYLDLSLNPVIVTNPCYLGCMPCHSNQSLLPWVYAPSWQPILVTLGVCPVIVANPTEVIRTL